LVPKVALGAAFYLIVRVDGCRIPAIALAAAAPDISGINDGDAS
jgi:hypothetical protein